MATADSPGLLAFASMPVPQDTPEGFQTAATMLKVIGWIRLISTALTALIGLVVILVATLFEAALISALESYPATAPAAAFGGALIVVLLVTLIIVLGVGIALLYWTSWAYAKWVSRRSASLGGIKAFAIVSIVLSGLGSLGILSGDLSALLSIAILVCSIIFLVKTNQPDVQAAFGQPPLEAPPLA